MVAEQLHRLAGIDWTGEVVEVSTPETADGLHWRTRMRYVTRRARPTVGLRAHRSHRVGPAAARAAAGSPHPDALTGRARATVTEYAAGRSWQVAADGFWQVHPAAADTLVAAVLDGLQPEAGERALDLYCGVGLFAGALADAGCRVWGLEASRPAVDLARQNLADVADRVTLTAGRVERGLARLPGRVDLVVLDPPRTGAGRDGDRAGRQPAGRGRSRTWPAIPAALARDLATAAGAGLRAAGDHRVRPVPDDPPRGVRGDPDPVGSGRGR